MGVWLLGWVSVASIIIVVDIVFLDQESGGNDGKEGRQTCLPSQLISSRYFLVWFLP